MYVGYTYYSTQCLERATARSLKQQARVAKESHATITNKTVD